MQGVKK